MKSLKNQLFLIVFALLLSSCSPNNTNDYDNVSQNTQTGKSTSISEIVNEENIEDSNTLTDEENIDELNNNGDELIDDQDGWINLDLVHEDYVILNDTEKHIYGIAKNNTDRLLYAPNITFKIINFDNNNNDKIIHHAYSQNYILPNEYLIIDFEVFSDYAYPLWNGSYQIEKIIALDYQELVNDGYFSDRGLLSKPLQVTNFWLENEYLLNIEGKNISDETISIDSYNYFVAFYDRFGGLNIDFGYNYFLSCKELAPGETIIIEGRWARMKDVDRAFPLYLPEDDIMNVYFSPIEVGLCNID
jgi:hypothetical protein